MASFPEEFCGQLLLRGEFLPHWFRIGLIEKYTREIPNSLTRSLNNAITSQLHCRSTVYKNVC
jgi:hypothetical protein